MAAAADGAAPVGAARYEKEAKVGEGTCAIITAAPTTGTARDLARHPTHGVGRPS